MDPVMPFDACTIWCIYDFHKRKDHDVTKNLSAIKPYREMSVGVKDRAGFQEEGCTVSAEVREKGTESTSHFYCLPIARAWQTWKVGQRQSRDTMGLHCAEQNQPGCHTQHGTWLGIKQISQNQHLVTNFSLVLLLLGIITLTYWSISAIISVLKAKRQC